jgi:hypothetical protein
LDFQITVPKITALATLDFFLLKREKLNNFPKEK